LWPSVNAPPIPPMMQEVLDKFEFFPIKCRVLRAKEDWSAYRKLLANEMKGFWGERKLRMKVMCAMWKVVAKRGCEDYVYRDGPDRRKLVNKNLFLNARQYLLPNFFFARYTEHLMFKDSLQGQSTRQSWAKLT
jgi:hypothetical protein